MSVVLAVVGVKFGRLSKSRVKSPCSPQPAVGDAVAEDGGNGLEKLDEVVVPAASVVGVDEIDADSELLALLVERVADSTFDDIVAEIVTDGDALEDKVLAMVIGDEALIEELLDSGGLETKAEELALCEELAIDTPETLPETAEA